MRICVCYLSKPRQRPVPLLFSYERRVAHISLVFREMWDTTALSL
jgi:hypothetical protein